MSNPIVVTLTTKNVYYKVADNVTAGTVNIKEWQPSDYRITYRTHNASAPSDDTLTVQCYSRVIEISNTSAIDVYMTCTKDIGKVIMFL